MLDQILKNLMGRNPEAEKERKERAAYFKAHAPQSVKDALQVMSESKLIDCIDQMTSMVIQAEAAYKKDYPDGKLDIRALTVDMLYWKVLEAARFPANEGYSLLDGWRAEIDHGEVIFIHPNGDIVERGDVPRRVVEDFEMKRTLKI